MIERDILACCLLSSENLRVAVERGVKPEWFEHNGAVFRSLCKIEKEWDETTYANILDPVFRKHHSIPEIVSSVPDWAFNIADVEDALDVMAEENISKRLLESLCNAQTSLQMGDTPSEVASLILDHLDGLLEGASDTLSTEELVEKALEVDKKIVIGERMGLPFPWWSLQRKTFGIPFGCVCPIGGRDGKGKSRLMSFLTEYWAKLGFPILYFPFEDGATRFISNVAATHGEYDMFTARRDYVPPDFLPKHEHTMQKVKDLPIYVEDYPCTAERITSTIAKYKRKYGIVGVVVDGFKDIVPSEGENRTSKEAHINSVLVRAARKYDVALIPVTHINKIEDDRWISRYMFTGAGEQNKSARFVMVYQDYVPPQLQSELGLLPDDIVLDVQKASYGDKATLGLRPELWKGRFVAVEDEDKGE